MHIIQTFPFQSLILVMVIPVTTIIVAYPWFGKVHIGMVIYLTLFMFKTVLILCFLPSDFLQKCSHKSVSLSLYTSH